MESPAIAPKMSLLAQFDDMCRIGSSFISYDEQDLIKLIHKCEENRIAWLTTKRELADMKKRFKRLEEDNHETVSSLRHVRMAFAGELRKREDLVQQRNDLQKRLSSIKQFVISEGSANFDDEKREKVLSFLNINQLETVNEDRESLDASLEDILEYDRSGDKILNDTYARPSTATTSGEAKTLVPSVDGKGEDRGVDEELKVNQISSEETKNENSMPTNDQQQNQLSAGASPSDTIGGQRYSAPHNRISSNPMQKPCNLSTIYSMSMSTLEERKHKLHQKKAFKLLHCNPCGLAINFLGNFFCCEECHAICHTQCKAKLPLPCIPLRKPDGKSAQMVVISDFAPLRPPRIPQLVYHCCNEIEKRGINEEGIYRKGASDKDIRDLKNKIMKSKTGMPSLTKYDVHILCGVLKQFLRELDEPIVTRTLWRDFVRASDQPNEEEEKALVMQTVEELPAANRDSLAFIVAHLIRVAANEANGMDCKALAKTFGPTIVGFSMIDPPMSEILAQKPKQTKVMESLFKFDEHYWMAIIAVNPSVNTPDRRSSTMSRTGRPSIGMRGPLTPLRNSSANSKDSLVLKPLF